MIIPRQKEGILTSQEAGQGENNGFLREAGETDNLASIGI